MFFFVDTNFFLQCKKYDQLKWSEITDDKDITIFITRPVQIEIDRLKNDGNSRRAKRARETTSLFRLILAERNLSFFVKTSKYNLTITFAKQYSDEILSQTNSSLDMSNDDDKILAILSNYLLERHINIESCAFLSNDTNPLLTAKLNNLPAIQIPDTWLLDPENDERDKEILRLSQQVSEYQRKEPLIMFGFKTNDYISLTKLQNEFDVKIHHYNQIEQSDIEYFVDYFKKKYPKQINFDVDEDELFRKINRITLLMYKYYPPNADEIKYYNEAYQKWENTIYEFISSYADKWNNISYIVPFNIIIKNNGNISAENLLLDFSILSGGQLVDPDFDDKVLIKRWAYPTPPKPPEGKFRNDTLFALDKFTANQARIKKAMEIISPTTSLNHLFSNSHDKNAFYWKDGRPHENIKSWRFVCEEFRHKLDDKQFPYHFTFDKNSEKVVFQIKVSASNMSSLLENTFIFHKKLAFIQTKNDILHLLKFGVTEERMEKIEGNDK